MSFHHLRMTPISPNPPDPENAVGPWGMDQQTITDLYITSHIFIGLREKDFVIPPEQIRVM